MRHAIQTAQTVQRVDEASDEADDIAVPAGVVDPGPEDKFWALMSRSTCNDRDKDYQPANLKVEQGELVQGRNDLVPKENDRGCQDVEDLVDDKGLPRFDLDVGVIQRV
jgi:hypothetical protein